MTNEEREEMNRLCRQIQVEQDHDAFTKLVEQLTELLSRKDRRLQQHERR